MNRAILRYRGTLAGKRIGASLLSLFPVDPLSAPPAITIFISNLNTRFPLELTLESLAACTSYPNYRVWVGENSSTDGSGEYLEEAGPRFELRVMASPKPRLHSEWLDEVFRTVETPYWCAVDSDMFFLGRDWLYDLVRVMERQPDVYVLSAERRCPQRGFVEPVAGETVDLAEAPSTWLFCVRTALREHLQTSFAFWKSQQARGPEFGGPLLCYDTGGKLLADMRCAGLRHAVMPARYRLKYYHFGGLSWATEDVATTPHGQLKRVQMADIMRRIGASGSLRVS